MRSIFRHGLAVLVALASSLNLPADDGWAKISADDLKDVVSPRDPDAPAEIVSRRIEIDFSDHPEGYAEKEYVRYKIYNPEKSNAYTRISRLDPYGNIRGFFAEIKITARLTLPDGTTRLFDKKDLKERSAVHQARKGSTLNRLFGSELEVTEKFLAVTGVLPGSILEFQTSSERELAGGFYFFAGAFDREMPVSLQHRDLFTREVQLTTRMPKNNRFGFRSYTLNGKLGNATIDEDKNRLVVKAQNLPAVQPEPLSGPPAYYTCTVLQCLFDTEPSSYSRRNVPIEVSGNTGKDGPWSIVAAFAYQRLEDRSEVTRTVRELEKKITAGAATPAEKARAIHKHMIGFAEEIRKESREKKSGYRLESSAPDGVESIDDLLDPKRRAKTVIDPTGESLNVAYALYKAAGLECRGVLLPNRTNHPFNPQMVAPSLLPLRAVAIKLDGKWEYSLPHLKPALPFGALPWYSESLYILAIKTGEQEMYDAPAVAARNARIGSAATLTLSADGHLSGEVRRRYYGHHAYQLRSRFVANKVKNPKRALQKIIEEEFEDTAVDGAETSAADAENEEDEPDTGAAEARRRVTVTKVAGLDDPEAPLEVVFSLDLPAYAQAVGERLLLRPSVFRTVDQHPFTAAVRTGPIRYPFPWQEIDMITLKYPEGFALEPAALPALPASKAILYRSKLTDDAATRTLTYRREYSHETLLIPPEQYANYKVWLDNIQHADSAQVALIKATASAANDARKTSAVEASPAPAP